MGTGLEDAGLAPVSHLLVRTSPVAWVDCRLGTSELIGEDPPIIISWNAIHLMNQISRCSMWSNIVSAWIIVATCFGTLSLSIVLSVHVNVCTLRIHPVWKDLVPVCLYLSSKENL